MYVKRLADALHAFIVSIATPHSVDVFAMTQNETVVWCHRHQTLYPFSVMRVINAGRSAYMFWREHYSYPYHLIAAEQSARELQIIVETHSTWEQSLLLS